jgi:hypothetical protein
MWAMLKYLRRREPQWRVRTRQWGNRIEEHITALWIFGSVLAAAALGSLKNMPPIDFSIEYFGYLTKALLVLVVYSLCGFLLVRGVARGLIWISNFRPRFWFVPKVGEWFEILNNDDRYLVLNVAVPKKISAVYLEYYFKRLRYDDPLGFVDYISEFRHDIQLIESSRGSGGLISHLWHKGSGPPYGILLGKRHGTRYALRLGDAFSVGYREGNYEMQISRTGEYRNWQFHLPDLRLKFSIQKGGIELDKDYQIDKQSKKIKEQKEKPTTKKGILAILNKAIRSKRPDGKHLTVAN